MSAKPYLKPLQHLNKRCQVHEKDNARQVVQCNALKQGNISTVIPSLRSLVGRDTGEMRCWDGHHRAQGQV